MGCFPPSPPLPHFLYRSNPSSDLSVCFSARGSLLLSLSADVRYRWRLRIRRYSGYIFTKKVVEIVHDAAAAAAAAAAKDVVAATVEGVAPTTPFFIYWAIHNTHAPIESPARFQTQYAHFGDSLKQTFTGMVSVVDESVKNVTDALKSTGAWKTTLFVWTTDNGSPINAGGSNHPLRGGKGSNWEGGIRTPVENPNKPP